jgi:site-specific recombinase XerD
MRFHRIRKGIEKAFAGDRWQDFGLLFISRDEPPGDSSNLRIDFNHIIEEAGSPKIRIHDLRHTEASVLLIHGMPVIVVSNYLGIHLPV